MKKVEMGEINYHSSNLDKISDKVCWVDLRLSTVRGRRSRDSSKFPQKLKELRRKGRDGREAGIQQDFGTK